MTDRDIAWLIPLAVRGNSMSSTTYASSKVSPEAQRFADMMTERLQSTIQEAERQSGGGSRGYGTYGGYSQNLGYGQQAGSRGFGQTPSWGGGGQQFGGWGGSRDFGPDMREGQQGMGTQELSSSEVQERFLPVLGALLPAIVSSVPSIIQSIRQSNRDILPQTTDPQEIERSFLSILQAVTPPIVQSIPQLIQMFSSNRDMPRDDQEAATRWFAPLAAVLLPHIVNATPHIVQALTGGRRDIRAFDPEVSERFLGPLLGSVLANVGQRLPDVINAFLGGRRYMPQPA